MKTTKLLLLSAIATALTYTSFAGDLLLSPRAKENQLKIITTDESGSATAISDKTPAEPVLLSPRAQSNLTKIVRGTKHDMNPALVCLSTMTGSPKAKQACVESGTMTGCRTGSEVARQSPGNWPAGTTLKDTAPAMAR